MVTDSNIQRQETMSEPNDQQITMIEDADIPTQHADICMENEERNEQEKIKTPDDEINSDALDAFDELHLELNGEVINNQMLDVLVPEDTNNRNNNPSRTKRGKTENITTDQHHSQTEPTNEMKEDGDPILEYADEPLLPLAEACAPLANILHDLDTYVKMALDGTAAEPPDSLTIDESAAIRLYTIEWSGGHRSLYSILNYTLKCLSREHLRPYFKYMKLFITAIVKLPCAPPCTVWRGVTKDLSKEFPPGTAVTWWAFSSTTTELSVLENNMYLGDSGSRTLFSLETINSRTIRAHSHFVTEDELLLLPGTYMIVQSLFCPAPDLHIIHLKQEIPETILLQPPFEGMSRISLVSYYQ
jgi:hypothetical protein